MEAKKFITRPDIMAIYEKEGMTPEVLASITEVAGYQIAKGEDKKEAEEDVIENPEVNEPAEEPVEEPTTEPKEEVIETPTEEPVEEPEIIVEEENEN